MRNDPDPVDSAPGSDSSPPNAVEVSTSTSTSSNSATLLPPESSLSLSVVASSFRTFSAGASRAFERFLAYMTTDYVNKVAFFLSVTFAGIAVYAALKALAFKLRGAKAEAQVISAYGHQKRLLFTSDFGDIEFLAGRVYSKRYRQLREGDAVPIIYNTNNPKLAVVDHWSELWMRPTMFGLGAFTFGLVALIFDTNNWPSFAL